MIPDRAFADLRNAVVKIVTAAARLRFSSGTQYDMTDFAARVMSSAAVNVGGPGTMLAGRSASWEAHYIGQLIEGTIGDDPLEWQAYRTEPITVPVNVAELIEASNLHPSLLGLDAATGAVCEEILAKLGDGPEADKPIDKQLSRLELEYHEEYRSDGDQFTEVVRRLAKKMLVPSVQVDLDTDPDSTSWDDRAVHNPDPWADPLVTELRQRDHDVVALPDIYVDRHVHSASPAMSSSTDSKEA